MFNEWAVVKGHPDYEVSIYGQVRERKTHYLLSQTENPPKGYLRVYMDKKRYYVHRLVAETFYDGDHTGLDVRHIDGDKYNNALSNLEWCTRKELLKTAKRRYEKCPSQARVVRCKFCVHRGSREFCRNRPDNFYCADGEVKSD